MPTRRQRRATRKKPTYYLLPLGVSIAIVLIVTVLFNVYVQMQQQQEQALRSEPIAQISIDSDNVDVIFNNERTRLFKGYRIDWNNGEGLETGDEARLSVPLSTKDQMRLDSNSTIFGRRDEGRSIVLGFNKGNMWLRSEAQKSANEATAVRMNTMRFVLTNQATVALADNESEELLAVVSGSVPVDITDTSGNTIKTLEVGVGQQIRLTPSMVASGSLDSALQAISAETTTSDWFTWNAQQDTQLASYEGTTSDAGSEELQVQSANSNVLTFSNITPNATFRTKVVALEGKFDPEVVAEIRINGVIAQLNESERRWTIAKLPLSTGKNMLKTTYTTVDGEEVNHSERTVTVDESAPVKPELLSPKQTDITSANVQLSGSVGGQTARVKINNYELQKYKPGDTSWLYYLNAGDNMSVGDNTYTVVAIDNVGNESEPLVVNITYTPSKVSTNTNASSSSSTQTTGASSTSSQTSDKPTSSSSTTTAKDPVKPQTPPKTVSPTKPKPTETTTPDDVLKPTNIRQSGSGSSL